MAYVTCVCRNGYSAPLGRSQCPQCGRINIRGGLLDDVSPFVKFLMFAGLAFLTLVIVGMVIATHNGG